MSCSIKLHDTTGYTWYTFAVLNCEFGAEFATLAEEFTRSQRIRRQRGRKVAWAMEAAESEDIGVLVMSLADRLRKARIVQFLPQAKQLRKAR